MLGSGVGYAVMMIGLMLTFMASQTIGSTVILVGCALFGLVLLFQLVTLPVEFDATKRAKQIVVAVGIVHREERVGMDKGLNAAAMTYVAVVVTTLLTLAYYLMRAFSGLSDD